ncbi:MAG: terpene cyclase/mutase family protein [Phycisphaerae bacterium]|nr:terpene cyclase/mutase family protein [Phycisphaerae bacterium]
MSPARHTYSASARPDVSLALAGVSAVTAVAVLVAAVVTARPGEAIAASPKAPSTALPEMLDTQTVRKINLGLKYLERTQRHDGSWVNSGGWAAFPVVMTSLAGLAFMANGSTPESGPYARTVSRALNYVLNVAESNVLDDGQIHIAGQMSGRSMYSHGFGTLFLAQCYGVEGDKASKRAQRIGKVLDGAVLLIAKAQSSIEGGKGGGWIYTPNGKSDEGSVTVTQLQALRACRNVGIKVPKKTIDKAVMYLRICQQADGGICYSYRSQGSSRPAISAAAIACFYSAGVRPPYRRERAGSRDGRAARPVLPQRRSRPAARRALLLHAPVHGPGDVPARRQGLARVFPEDTQATARSAVPRRELAGRRHRRGVRHGPGVYNPPVAVRLPADRAAIDNTAG